MKRLIGSTLALNLMFFATVGLRAGEVCSAALKHPNCVAILRWDPILGRRFVSIANTDHPDWPATLVSVSGSLSATEPITPSALPQRQTPPATLPLVRAGQTVTLWKHEAELTVEIKGIAEDNGTIGQLIRVRYIAESDAGRTQQEIAGIVRGPASVEMAR